MTDHQNSKGRDLGCLMHLSSEQRDALAAWLDLPTDKRMKAIALLAHSCDGGRTKTHCWACVAGGLLAVLSPRKTQLPSEVTGS